MGDPLTQFDGDIPRHYDEGLGPILFVHFASDLARRVAQEDRPPREILELAAGTGILTRKLATALPDARLLATDLNPAMLAIAQQRLGREARVAFAEANAMQIGLGDDSLDALVCQFGVMFFPDKVASFREARRVLRPGAPYWFNSWGDHRANPFAAIVHDTVSTLFPDDPPGFYRLPFSYSDIDVIAADLAAAGFADVEIETVSIDQPVIDWEAFTKGIVYGNPLHTELAAREGPDAEIVRARIRENLVVHLGSTPTTMPLCAHIVRACD